MRILLGSFTLSLMPALLSGLALAQSPAPQAVSATPPPGAMVLHAGTRLVLVDVVVRDRNGRPVHGLTRDDFATSENQVPQTLRAFDEYAPPSTPPTPPPAPVLPPGTFTDYTPVPASGPLDVLLIDSLNTPLTDQAYLRAQLVDYARHAQPGHRVAILGLGDHLYLLQGFTSDPSVLLNALKQLKDGRPSPLLKNSSTTSSTQLDSLTLPGTNSTAMPASALMTNGISTFLEQISVGETGLRVQETLEGFTSLGRWLSNFPGRKNVIWFSGSFPLGVLPNTSLQNKTDVPSEDGDQFRALTNLLTSAQVSIYPVDPRGVQVDSAFDVAGGANVTEPSFTSQLDSSADLRGSDLGTMEAIASDTGGQVFHNRNNLADAVSTIASIGGSYYTLAYTPSERKTGGEWRSIQVKLAGDADHHGYSLFYRRGYYADNLRQPAHATGTAEVSAEKPSPRKAARRYADLAMLYGAPTPSDILFSTQVLPYSKLDEDTLASGNVVDPKDPLKPPYRRYDVRALASSHAFTLTAQPNGHYAGAIELAAFVYSTSGKLLNTAAQKLTLDFTPETYSDFRKHNAGLHLQVSVPAHTECVLRIGVQDLPSNRIGAVELPISEVSHLSPDR